MRIIEKHSIQTEQDAIQVIKNQVRIKASIEHVVEPTTSHAQTAVGTIGETLEALKQIRDHFDESQSYELHYWLGKGYSWCGQHYSSIEHFEKAYQLSDGQLTPLLPEEEKEKNDAFDQIDIAYELGESCLKIEHPSFVEKAIQYLQSVRDHCTDYHPGLALLAEAYFQLGRYREAAETADQANTFLKKNSRWLNKIENPKFLTTLMSKCYSREALRQRDNGEISKVVSVLKMARQKSVIKPVDDQLLKRLEQQEKILIREKHHLEEVICSRPVILTIRRELKKKHAEVTFDYEAINKELQRRLNRNQTTPSIESKEEQSSSQTSVKANEEAAETIQEQALQKTNTNEPDSTSPNERGEQTTSSE